MGKKLCRRIKDKSRTYPKVDAEKIAKALGADCSFSHLLVDSNDGEYFESRLFGDKKTKKIYRLMDNEVGRYKLLCETEGEFFFHCVFMARRTENFCKRVVGYQILNTNRRNMKWRVVFYEKA